VNNFSLRVARLAGMAALVGLMAVISAANRVPHHPAVHFCCGYTPARLAAGAWWTVPGSALLVVHLRPFGSDTALLLAVVLPFVLREGFRKAAAAFFTGHVVATLAVAAVVLPLAAGGFHPAEATRVRVDVGSSAGVAAVAGALAVSRRRPGWGGAAAVGRPGWGAAAWLRRRGWAVLIGLTVGVLLGRWWWPVSSPVHGHPGTLSVVDSARRSR
jgi:hypothetical protein